MRRLPSLAAALAVLVLVSPIRPRLAATGAPQQVQFRAGVDLVAVDVQVVDREGRPIPDLTPADFQVSFQGKSRKVVSADLIRYETTDGQPLVAHPAATITPAATAAIEAANSRLVLIAIDAMSLSVSDARGAVVAAQAFVRHLPATSRVGLLTFPSGPLVNPTTDHLSVRLALDKVTGQHMGITEGTRFRVQPGDIVDVTARDPEATRRVDNQNCPPNDPGAGKCVEILHNEIEGSALLLQSQAIATLETFGSVLESLEKMPGRKIIVLVSAGIPTADRQGGLPDIGDLPIQLGERAARANATVYTLFLDHGYLQRNSAETQQGRVKNGIPNFAHDSRDDELLGRWLDLFAGAAGGGFMRVQVGDGESSYDRILSETSAYYMLGVEPQDKDRDGRSHEMKVKTTRKGATIRSRAWAVIPAK